MGLTFSYDLIDSDETEKIYRQMLADDVAKVLTWRSGSPTREALPIEASYTTWWLQSGPTSFASGEDSLRYKRELLDEVRKALTTRDT